MNFENTCGEGFKEFSFAFSSLIKAQAKLVASLNSFSIFVKYKYYFEQLERGQKFRLN